jgi:hypothetical protein
MPTLPSLLPKLAAAQAMPQPVRFVQFGNAYSMTAPLFWGNLSPNNRVAPNVNIRDLSSVSGPLSYTFGTAFDPLRSKMSLIRGLDVLIVNPNHNYTFAGCASGYDTGLDGDEYPPLAGQPSVDMVIASSAKVNGSSVPATQRLLTLNPMTTDDYANNRSFTWQGSGSSLQIVRPLKQTQALFDTFATGFGAVLQPADTSEQSMVQSVYADYKAVRDGARISAADRTRLDAYLSLINDVESSLTAVPAQTCQGPTQQNETNIDQVVDNQLRILAAAMACNLTRVATVTLGMGAGYGTRHSEHHSLGQGNDSGDLQTGLVQDVQRFGGYIASFLKLLDSVSDVGGGTLLDNSVVTWTMQYGVPVLGGQHCAKDMPVMVAGGARGQLKQGSYLDLRKEGGGDGLPYNNHLVTVMNCMGLGSSDYETSAGNGYGYYTGDFSNRPGGTATASTAGRRTPLPYLYGGPNRG